MGEQYFRNPENGRLYFRSPWQMGDCISAAGGKKEITVFPQPVANGRLNFRSPSPMGDNSISVARSKWEIAFPQPVTKE
jgi:hypothetical protein